ncbi:Protein IDA-LIKE 4 [Capsicum chinense]|uniref:protein IDA-LIKE 2 n=1 Tax=Capsicum annuum TaxID=4072 RepID=UPI0007BF07F7|nr:protein IDA-LIKE 2 [Capsicum annuum]PHU00420.1 Protein IDA-LIKE 4 [Capsicum chinense]
MISFFRRKVPLILLFWMAIILISIFGHCHGSRSSSQVFNPINSQSYKHGHFWNLLPKRIPIPASGPSRKHNDIGLKSTWRLP